MADTTPLPDREDHVGGIESMTVDGRRWYFGFDYSSDIAVSPLIDDPSAMALFASRHMRQTDGAHDEVYWRDLVDDSVATSSLADEEEHRTYTSADLSPTTQLTYLLGAATAWDDTLLHDPAFRAGLATIGAADADDWDCLDACTAALESDDPAVRATASLLLTQYRQFIFERLPGNWAVVFAALRPAA